MRERQGNGTLRSRLRHLAGNAARLAGLKPPRPGPLDEWLKRMSIFREDERRALLNADLMTASRIPAEIERQYDSGQSWEFCSWLQYLDLKNYLPGAILAKVDVASMYHGLEVRVPILDHRVVELAARIPVRHKLRWSSDGIAEGKRPLRRLVSRFYGSEFSSRRKQGFATPFGPWLQNGQLATVRERLLDSSSRLTDLFDRRELDRIAAMQTVPRRASWKIWLLLFLAEWFQQHQQAVV